ncbi:MAG: acyl-CoA thioesterase [Cellvibrionaceae bacterium]
MPARSQPRSENFPFRVELATRFDDLDTQGHINNVAIANLYQEARLRFHGKAFGELRGGQDRDDGIGTVLVDIHITYQRETHYPLPVTIACGVGRLGNTSYTIKSVLFQDSHCVGTCDAVLVYVKAGKPQPIPREERAILGDYQLVDAR